MRLNCPAKIIRTDKWWLDSSDEQRVLFAATVEEYRKLCRYLVTVVNTLGLTYQLGHRQTTRHKSLNEWVAVILYDVAATLSILPNC